MKQKRTDLQEGDVVAINKPIGKTSHDIIQYLRKKTGIRRIGHAGTLDPLATGVLIVLIGRSATKQQAEYMSFPKKYSAEITFGFISQTRDAQGPIEKSASTKQLKNLTAEDIQNILPLYTGTIQQIPPAYSAIKKNGVPLYKKARAGNLSPDDIIPRSVQIDSITLEQFLPMTADTPPRAQIEVSCQKGVYIRSLVHDIGQSLHVGAYMSALTRTAIGSYTIETALTLDDF